MKKTKKCKKNNKNVTKKNKQKMYLSKGGGKDETWNDYFNRDPTWQGPYFSLGIEKWGNYLGNFTSKWKAYFMTMAMKFNPSMIAANMAGSVGLMALDKGLPAVMDTIEKQSAQIKKIQKIFTMPKMPELPKVPEIKVPEIKVPEVKVPEVKVPEVKVHLPKGGSKTRK